MTDRPDLAAPAMPASPRTATLSKYADTWRRAYWAHREVPGRHRGECCQDECWPDIAERVIDEIAPAIVAELSEAEAAQQQSAPAGTDSQAAPLDVEALADALHHVMCKVSHHDSNFRERSCFASFPLIASAALARLVQERSE
jgi:hypothetical protein